MLARVQRGIENKAIAFELWADDPDSDVAFAPARFRSGVQFALRETALHRDPLRDLPSAPSEPTSSPLQTPLSPRIHSHGLSGGALWPFESRNVFNSLLAAPSSTGTRRRSRPQRI